MAETQTRQKLTVPPRRYLFGPCRERDHAECRGRIHNLLQDEVCTCRCHRDWAQKQRQFATKGR
jgi:hypothetical protein